MINWNVMVVTPDIIKWTKRIDPYNFYTRAITHGNATIVAPFIKIYIVHSLAATRGYKVDLIYIDKKELAEYDSDIRDSALLGCLLDPNNAKAIRDIKELEYRIPKEVLDYEVLLSRSGSN